MIFQPFKKAHAADTPRFVAGAEIDRRANEAEDARNDQMIGGGIDTYNQFMGDDTPIRDWGRGILGLENNVASGAVPELANALRGAPLANAGAAGAISAAPTTAGIAAMAPSALPAGIAAPAAAILPELGMAGATGAAGAGAAGLAGPAGIALALAGMLGLFG